MFYVIYIKKIFDWRKNEYIGITFLQVGNYVSTNYVKINILVLPARSGGGGGLTCVCCDMGMCHYFVYFSGGAPGFLGIIFFCKI